MTSAPDPKPVLGPLGEQGQILARESKEALVLWELCGVTPQATTSRVLTDSRELQKVGLLTEGVFGSRGSGEEGGVPRDLRREPGLESLCLPYQGSEDIDPSVSLPWGPWRPSFWHWLQA